MCKFGNVHVPRAAVAATVMAAALYKGQLSARREYALRPGTQAPLVGTLMEVVRALRCSDGRLIILALGVGRLRVHHRDC